MSHKPHRSKVSDHILQTSSNLLGLCFVILSLIKINNIGSSTFLDELLTFPILLFFSSAILSYLSLRRNEQPEVYEIWADRIFITGLFAIAIISLIFIYQIVD